MADLAASVLNRRLVHQHDGNVILDRVDAVTFLASQSRVILHEPDRGLALRTHQNLEESGIDGHCRNITEA
jgi:hypothetical protein